MLRVKCVRVPFVIPVLSSSMTMLFQARLWSGFSTVAFLHAFSASTCLFRSAYYHDENREYNLIQIKLTELFTS